MVKLIVKDFILYDYKDSDNMKKILITTFVLIFVFAASVIPAQALTSETLDNNAVFSQETFQKEKVDSWARQEIMAAREAGLIPQLTDDPAYKDNITREQFAELVVKAVEKITGEEAPIAPFGTFADTSNESVLKAYMMGIINGRAEGIFDPKATATRQEIATMISRALDYIKAQTGKDLAPLTAGVEMFADGDRIAKYAKSHVGRLAANGVMNGSLDVTGLNANPTAKCKVQESILLLYRVYANSL